MDHSGHKAYLQLQVFAKPFFFIIITFSSKESGRTERMVQMSTQLVVPTENNY